MDTLRFRHRLDSRNYERMGGHEHREGPRSERWLQRDGVRIGAYPDGLVYAEARGAVMLDGPDAHHLVTAAEVAEAGQRTADLLRSLGLDAEDDPRVGRCDLTADLVFEDGDEGRALLRAASYVDLPWLKAGTEGGKRTGLESVLWRTVQGRSVQLRLYDKSVETGIAAPGTWLRLERQQRFRKSREQTASSLIGENLGALFVRRYVEALMGVPELVVCDRARAVDELRRRQAAGTITPARARTLAGFVLMGDDGLGRSTAYKWWAELRKLGIVLDVHAGDGRVVELAEYARRAGRAWERAA